MRVATRVKETEKFRLKFQNLDGVIDIYFDDDYTFEVRYSEAFEAKEIINQFLEKDKERSVEK